MIQEAIAKLTEKQNLSFQEAEEVFRDIFEHKTTPAQTAAFLVSLRMKEEKEEEIHAAACVIREKATKLKVRNSSFGIEDKEEPVIDTCGTGGSGLNKFNISTVVAFVVAALGIKVAKHGNKAMSSNCGSADVLKTLGIKVEVKPQVMEEAIKKVGIGFLYAPLYHPALKEVAQIRREIRIRTIFNILGPLCNPALANYQLLGVYSQKLTFLLARVLKKLAVKRAFVVWSKDLKDEISLSGSTQVSFLNNKKIENFNLKPSDFGLKKIEPKSLMVNDKEISAKVINGIFEKAKGSPRDIVLANAAACFYILGKVNNLKQGVKLASDLIDKGKVKEKFLQFKEFIDKNA